ncbi:peptidoglycan-binding protein [Streptomyces sp. NPDC052494]|uniref:peptidoglycan-binding domain-containing protein n=1 Tax=Streptomyces sp. NPDC052494 TaxID=3365692 RepID=UPI0037CD7FE4
MTGHVCPECGVQRPGCACARAEIAAAEDFDPLRIRPYVTLEAAGAGGPSESAGPSYAEEDPPTTQLAAIRPEGPYTGPYADPYAGPSAGQRPDPYADPHPGLPNPDPPYSDVPYSDLPHSEGDASETMPLLLHGIGRVEDPADEQGRESARGRRRGMVVAAVAAVAVAGTAAFAAAVLGGADDSGDRASGLEVTTSASLNVAVSEAPSPSASSETPEPSASSPSAGPTTASASASPSATSTPSASRTTASPSATTGAAAPPATTTAAPTTTAPTAAPTTTTPPTSQAPQEPEETEEASTTLSFGSSGAEVMELQERLTLAGAYHGDLDGEYSQEVWRAVKNYQSWMFIEEDPKGVYGPHTREALERSTWL